MDESRTGRVPVVAVVGRPNVGKSSLVNRILGRRDAIVEATPGVTRDRRSFRAEWAGRTFEVVDTGGLEPGAEGLDARVVEQAQVAIQAADVIVLVVDAVAGPLEDDLLVAAELRRTEKPVLVAANKVDDPRDEPAATTSTVWGWATPSRCRRCTAEVPATSCSVSSIGCRRKRGCRTRIGRRRPSSAVRTSGSRRSSTACWGRTARSCTRSPGPTRDPVDSLLDLGEGRRLRIVDTAGMRRQVQLKDPLEYYSWLRSRQTLERVDVAILVIDASEGVTGHDQRIADEIGPVRLACVVVLNKWDLVTDRRNRQGQVGRLVRGQAPVPRLGGRPTNFGGHEEGDRPTHAGGDRGDRIAPAAPADLDGQPTRTGCAGAPSPSPSGRTVGPDPLRGTGEGGAPDLHPVRDRSSRGSYLRFIEHRIREAEPFPGTPLRVQARLRERREPREPSGG